MYFYFFSHFLSFLTWFFFLFSVSILYPCPPIDFSHYFMYPLTFFLNWLFWDYIILFLHHFEMSTTHILYSFNVIQELGNVNLIILFYFSYSSKCPAVKLKFQILLARSWDCHYLRVQPRGLTTFWALVSSLAMGVSIQRICKILMTKMS